MESPSVDMLTGASFPFTNKVRLPLFSSLNLSITVIETPSSATDPGEGVIDFI